MRSNGRGHGAAEAGRQRVQLAEWDSQKNPLTLWKPGWKGSVGKAESIKSLPGEWATTHGEFEMFEVRNFRLNQHAAIFLLQGGTLANVFDGSLLVNYSVHLKVRPFILAFADGATLLPSTPGVRVLRLARVRNLFKDVTTDELRAALFYLNVGHDAPTA